jgi:hypothetical protein
MFTLHDSPCASPRSDTLGRHTKLLALQNAVDLLIHLHLLKVGPPARGTLMSSVIRYKYVTPPARGTLMSSVIGYK